ncbi:hypothetical protein OF83DRAFT_1175226 [Amylostereum chailletii]|nr:hypothetical protein OF83DRAFT_1175226 [Amylostereum chailletii]
MYNAELSVANRPLRAQRHASYGFNYDGEFHAPYDERLLLAQCGVDLNHHSVFDQGSPYANDRRQVLSGELNHSVPLTSASLVQNGFYPQQLHGNGAAYTVDASYNLSDSFSLPLHSPVPLLPSTVHVPFHYGDVSPSIPLDEPRPSRYTPPAHFPTTRLLPDGQDLDLIERNANIHLSVFTTPPEPLSSPLGTQQEYHAKAAFCGTYSSKHDKEETRRSETVHQARQRFMSESIGFCSTNPDDLSCHDKKRRYFECLEEYVVYLRNQVKLAGLAPPAFTCVSTGTSRSTRSIRTMILHTEGRVRNLHQRTLQAEAEVLALETRVRRQ